VNQTLSARSAAPAAPHFVAYDDKWITPPSAADLQGYNVYAITFWRPNGAVDQAENWAGLDVATRTLALTSYRAAGIKTVVSAFGAQFFPTSGSPALDPTQTADQLAAWVIQYGLDGVDIDYEDYTAMDKKDGSAEQWLITFTTELRNKLPASDYFISHAPLAPWFSPVYTSGGYLEVNKQVGSMIDWYNVPVLQRQCRIFHLRRPHQHLLLHLAQHGPLPDRCCGRRRRQARHRQARYQR